MNQPMSRCGLRLDEWYLCPDPAFSTLTKQDAPSIQETVQFSAAKLCQMEVLLQCQMEVSKSPKRLLISRHSYIDVSKNGVDSCQVNGRGNGWNDLFPMFCRVPKPSATHWGFTHQRQVMCGLLIRRASRYYARDSGDSGDSWAWIISVGGSNQSE